MRRAPLGELVPEWGELRAKLEASPYRAPSAPLETRISYAREEGEPGGPPRFAPRIIHSNVVPMRALRQAIAALMAEYEERAAEGDE